MEEKIIIAGSGGQGALTIGVFFARVAALEGKTVSWLPSYGAEKRGGFSYCHVIVSDSEIFSPVVDTPDTLIAFDQRAYDFYSPKSGKDTLEIINTSLVKETDHSKSKDKLLIPAADIAAGINFLKAMNMVVAGAYTAARGIFSSESAYKIVNEVLKKKQADIIRKNILAFDEGVKFVKERAAAK